MSAAGESDRPTAPGAARPLPAGRVGRPHGLDGSFYVTRPRPRLLLEGTHVTLDSAERAIVRRAGTEARPIIRLEGIDSRAAAEALRGGELTVAGADAPQLEEGEWWAHELEGCSVFDSGVLVGTVARLLELPSCEALEVDRADGAGQLLVPMVKAAIRAIEPGERRVEVDLEFLGAEPPGAGA